MMRPPSLLSSCLAGALALGACSGSIVPGDEPGQTPTTPTPTDPGKPPPDGSKPPPVPNTPDTSPPTPGAPDRNLAVCRDVKPGPAFLRRLTRAEYDSTVRDLLGEDKALAQKFPPEELHHGFANSDIRTVSEALAEAYVKAAEDVGKTVSGAVDKFVGCDPAQKSDDACLAAFFDGFGKRLWRRPLTSDERQRLTQRFKDNRGASFAEGLDAVVQIMMLSPSFLYRAEVGQPIDGASYQKVGQYEMASRLSYLIWGTLPDAELFKAADAGALGTRAEVYAQAQRMVADPRAAGMVANFSEQWLSFERLDEVVKDADLFPEYKPELIDLFRRESAEMIKSVWKDGAQLGSFLTAPYTFMNGALAAFYGASGVTGDAWRKVDLDKSKRVGVLSHGSIMLGNASVDQTSPIKRGLFVQDRMFCFEVPDPPADANIEPVKIDPKLTARERFSAHRADPSCNGCHQYIDPIGFAFENYDAIGKWRATEAGKTIDASGSLTGTDVDGAFNGPIELATKLSESSKVRSCVAKQWFRFAYGRDPGAEDACAKQTLETLFNQSKGDFRQLVLALTQTDTFMFRQGGTQ